ncbi:patatin-like phospholipase family protein [soil metagenome]
MTRALVLGGGGVTGIAWELGVLAGLSDAGVALTSADLVIGTSAGSTVGAQITSGATLDELLAAQMTPTSESKEIAVDLDFDRLAEIFGVLYDESVDPLLRRRLVGEMARSTETVAESVRREVIETRLPSTEWPTATPLVLIAVDANSGEWVRFDRDSGVSLIDAVAASCAVPGVWPPVTIDGRRYVDGGVRSSTNADLAEGHDKVLVLTPLGEAMAIQVKDEVSSLIEAGASVTVLAADEEALAAMGPNPLDPELRAAAAEAGRRQGLAEAERVAAWW